MYNFSSTNGTEVESDMNESFVNSWNDTDGECGVELSEEDRDIISYYRYNIFSLSLDHTLPEASLRKIKCHKHSANAGVS